MMEDFGVTMPDDIKAEAVKNGTSSSSTVSDGSLWAAGSAVCEASVTSASDAVWSASVSIRFGAVDRQV